MNATKQFYTNIVLCESNDLTYCQKGLKYTKTIRQIGTVIFAINFVLALILPIVSIATGDNALLVLFILVDLTILTYFEVKNIIEIENDIEERVEELEGN